MSLTCLRLDFLPHFLAMLIACLLLELSSGQPTPAFIRMAEASSQGLPNMWRVTEGVYCGGEPEGAEAFHTLEKLGVKTLVSVDGVRPQLELAKEHHLRYVHIPTGYHGVDEHAQRSLARVAREVERPIYVHCHHGRHRGPAAAAVLGRTLGTVNAREATRLLEIAGTDPRYAGLWRDVQAWQPPPPGALLPELVPLASVDSLAEAMARVDRRWDAFREALAEPSAASDEPHAFSPLQEAVLLRETMQESLRALPADAPSQQRQWFGASLQALRELEMTLATDALPPPATVHAIGDQCRRCHQVYRDR